MKLTWALGISTHRHEDGCVKMGRKLAKQLGDRLHAASGGADRDNVGPGLHDGSDRNDKQTTFTLGRSGRSRIKASFLASVCDGAH
jgi:hypothetical protein